MAKKRDFKTTIKTSDNSLSVTIEEDISQMVNKIKKVLEDLPLKNSITQAELDCHAEDICNTLLAFDEKARKSTDKQLFDYLGKIDKALGKAHWLIEDAPIEVKNLLICANSEIDDLPEVYSSLFPEQKNLINFRNIIGRLRLKNKYLKEKTELIKKQGDSKESLQKDRIHGGKQKNPHLEYLSTHLTSVFSALTGEDASYTYDPVKSKAKGVCYNFMDDIFSIGKIKASPENRIKQSKKLMELTKEK